MEKELFLGIDDAGRGPVIGPMVLAGVIITKQDEQQLKEIGVTDSKKILPKKRQELAEFIKKSFDYHYEITSAEEIDQRNEVGINLNKLVAIKAAKIINKLSKKIKQEITVIIDCPSTNTENWKKCVLSYVENPEKINLKAEHKADINHICCSAASIIAKTTRDLEIEKLKKEINLNFGSGYCSDPLTCKSLKENLNILLEKRIIRKSWSTFSDLQKEKQQQKLF